MTPRVFGVRFSLAYAFLMIGNGVQLPFLPLWLHSQGLSLSANSAVIAAMTVVRVFGAPLFSALADYSGKRLVVIRLCAAGSCLSYFALSQAQGFNSIVTLGALAAFMFSPVFPLIEGFSIESAARVGFDYGRVRLWASLSFLAGSLGSGYLLTLIPIESAMLLIAVAQMTTALSTWILPKEPPHPAHLPQVSDLRLGEAFRFLLASRFTVFLLAASLGNCSHGMLFAESTVHWVSLGFSTFHIGILWASAVLSEVALFFFSAYVISQVPLPRILCLGLFGATMRWIGIGFAVSFWGMFAAQLLHAISFALTHLALMHFIRINVPQNLRNTAQGLYTAFAGGLLLSATQWVSGPLYEWAGGRAFLFMALISTLGFVVALFNLYRLSPTVPQVAVASRH